MTGNLDGLGPVTGFTGLALAAAGVLLALLAGLRLLFLIRRPGKGRIATGIAVAGLVLLMCGAALLAVEELSVLHALLRVTDRAPWALATVSLVLAVAVGVRAGLRRGPRAEPVDDGDAGAGEDGDAGDGEQPGQPAER